MRTYSATIGILAAALAFASPALAEERVQRTTGVTYADLDLQTEAGRAELEQRIERAARQVCGMDESTVGSRIASREARACYRETKQQLDQQFAQILQDTRFGAELMSPRGGMSDPMASLPALSEPNLPVGVQRPAIALTLRR